MSLFWLELLFFWRDFFFLDNVKEEQETRAWVCAESAVLVHTLCVAIGLRS